MRVLVAVALVSACSSAHAQQWSATTVQAVPGQSPFYQMTSVDVPTPRLTVWAEHYGVPWDAFAAAPSPPPSWAWTQTMRTIATGARATGKPLDLQLLLARDKPADHATATGLVAMPACMDLGAYRVAYGRYVTWMVQLFRPATVNVSVEISRYATVCGTGSGWASVVAVANEGYTRAKQARPWALVYASVQAEDLYGHALTGFDDGLYAALSGIQRDRFGLSLYPQVLVDDDPARLPDDYLSRARDRHPTEKPVVVAETGWLSAPLVLGTPDACWTALTGSVATQAQYRAWLSARAAADGVSVVTWWSSRDLIPTAVMTGCVPTSCPPGDAWCASVNAFRAVFGQPAGDLIFKAFGAMGLSGYAGDPK